jgi:hypothetical protein
MAEYCFTAGQAGAPGWLRIRVGRAVEWVVRQDYCRDRGGCKEFILGGNGTDFFDENFANSGTSRCRFLAEYIVTHHSTLNRDFIAGSCEIQKRPVDEGDDENERFAIPDIITDEPGFRTEFYEVKPNSYQGREAGRKKIETFLSLLDFLKVTDPSIGRIAKGVQYSPDRYLLIYQTFYLGIIPCEVRLHYFLREDALIVYEFCVRVDGELLEALATAIVVSALIVLCYLIFRGGLRIPTTGGVPVMADVIGPGEPNHIQDVRYVQALLNDWLLLSVTDLIEVNGVLTGETIAAMTQFQTSWGLDVTNGRVTPADDTITALEVSHMNKYADKMDQHISGLQLDEAGPFIAQESEELVDTEAGDLPVSQVVFDEACYRYLQLMHDYV